MAEQAANNSDLNAFLAPSQHVWRDQVEHDGVVIARVQCNPLFHTRIHYPLHDIQRAVTIERCDLYSDHLLDLGEAPPEIAGQRNAADRRLQIKTDQRHNLSDRAAVRDQLVLARALHGGEAQQTGVIPETEGYFSLSPRLLGPADDPGDHHQRAAFSSRFRRNPKHRFVKIELADSELRRMHTHGQAAYACVDVIPAERALSPRIQPALGIEREEVGRDDGAATKCLKHVMRPIGPAKPHRLSPVRTAHDRTSAQSVQSSSWPEVAQDDVDGMSQVLLACRS